MSYLPSVRKWFLKLSSDQIATVRAKKGDCMKKYVIEREISKIGTLTPQQVREAAAKSNSVLAGLGPDIQWQESYITADKMFCVYLAKDEQAIQKHAALSGFPATTVTEICQVIDPTTGA